MIAFFEKNAKHWDFIEISLFMGLSVLIAVGGMEFIDKQNYLIQIIIALLIGFYVNGLRYLFGAWLDKMDKRRRSATGPEAAGREKKP